MLFLCCCAAYLLPIWNALIQCSQSADRWSDIQQNECANNSHNHHESFQSATVQCLLPRQRSHRFEPHQRHCVVCLSKNISPSLVLVQPTKTLPFITERLLMGRKESNQTNKQSNVYCTLFIVLEFPVKAHTIHCTLHKSSS